MARIDAIVGGIDEDICVITHAELDVRKFQRQPREATDIWYHHRMRAGVAYGPMCIASRSSRLILKAAAGEAIIVACGLMMNFGALAAK